MKFLKYSLYVILFIGILTILKAVPTIANIYISEYIRRFIAAIGMVILIKIAFSKKYIINTNNALDECVRKFFEKHIRGLDIISRGLILVLAISIFTLAIIPAILDLQHLIKGEFITTNCVTLSSDNYGTLNEKRSIQVKDIEKNEIIYLNVKYTQIEVNEYFTIEYLPNMGIGQIIKKY